MRLPAAAPATVRERFSGSSDCSYDLAIILGSGWGTLVEKLAEAQSISYGEIPGFSASSVSGHGARLWTGVFNGWRLLVFQGRYHLYEGYKAADVVRPVELAAELGCSRLILTNAAGGIPAHFSPGDFMFVEDHLNLTGDNPLRGLSEPAFIDVSHLYRCDLFPALAQGAQHFNIKLHQGVLASLMGPSYETPAEVRMVETLGGHALSMSTVPEAIMARYLGLDVVALSLISNLAAGVAAAPLSHDEVLDVGRRGACQAEALLTELIDCWRAADRSD